VPYAAFCLIPTKEFVAWLRSVRFQQPLPLFHTQHECLPAGRADRGYIGAQGEQSRCGKGATRELMRAVVIQRSACGLRAWFKTVARPTDGDLP